MNSECAEVSLKGKTYRVPAFDVDGKTIIVSGKWIRLAMIHDEDWQEGEMVADPISFIARLKTSGLKADVFTFAQKLPETSPKYDYHYEWENVAAIPTHDFQDWWENRLPQETRKNVRKSTKRNVVVKQTEFDDALIAGLKRIYDEAPVRQGRRFWHYGKGLNAIRKENSSYLNRSELIGAYWQDELIGFLKMVYVDKAANVMQIVCKLAHVDKKPMNALIAKAVEICARKGIAYFVYGRYVYGNNTSGHLTEFKRRNGFEQILLPRYYIPLNFKGRLMLKLGFHHGLRYFLPTRIESFLLKMRSAYHEKRLSKRKGNIPSAASALDNPSENNSVGFKKLNR
jgi:hypothetical protein